jgi:Flp pilus assembly protein TadB
MAQTKKKRRRKHRGTQAGTVHKPVRTSSASKGRGGSKTTAAQRRSERLDRIPTWRGAFNRSVLAAAVFGLLVIVLFKQPVQAGVSLAAVMVIVYWPMSYFTDKLIYNRRQRSKAKS